MKIDRIEVDGFGHFQGLSLQLSPGMNLLYGPNEAGKSTLLSFVRALLFGFERQSSPERYATSGAYGGRLLLSTDRESFWVERRSLRKVEGELSLWNESGAPLEAHRLSQALYSLNKDLYRQVFAFGLGELSDFSKLASDRDIAEALLAAGTEGAKHLPRAMDQLRDQLESRFKPRSPIAPLNALLKELSSAREERASQEDLPDRYRDLNESLAFLEEEQTALWVKRGAAEEKHQDYSRILAGKKSYEALCLAEEKLRGLPDLSKVPEGAEERLTALVQQEDDALDGLLRAEAVQKRRKEAETRALSEALTQESEVTLSTAVEGVSTLVGIAQALPKRTAALMERKALAQAVSSRVGLSIPLASLDGLDFSAAARAKLVDLKERTEVLSREAFRFEQTHDRTQAAANQLPATDSSPSDGGEPTAKLPQLGFLLFGVALLLAAAVAYAFYTLGPAAGGVVGGISLSLFLLGGELYRRFSWAERQAIARQQQLGVQKRDERAELLARRSVLLAEAQESNAGLVRVKDRLSALQEEVNQFASPYGLVAGLSADSVLELFSELSSLRQRFSDLNEEAASLAADQERVDAAQKTLLACSAKFGGPSTLWVEALAFCRTRLDKGRSATVEFGRLSLEERMRSGEMALAQDKIHRSENALVEFLALLEAKDVQSGLVRCEEARRQRGLRMEVMNQKAQLQSLSGLSPQGYAETLLRVGGGLALEEACAAEAETLRTLGEAQRALDSRAGELKSQLAEISRLDHTERLRAKEEELSARVESLSSEYVFHLISLRLLERAAANFERSSQPRVVRNAKALFSELTRGRYANVFFPLEGSGELCVVDARGAQRSAESLSRGTREQLYLAFRLALVQDFAEQKGPLPILLDDILVNFDPVRALATLRVVSRLAATHQIIAFTCHPWLKDAFVGEGAKLLSLAGKAEEDLLEAAATWRGGDRNVIDLSPKLSA